MDIIKDILNLFGLEGKLFIAQIINFAILLFILKKFLYEPIAKMMEERKSKIKQGLDDAENAKKALIEADNQKILILKEAKVDADKILENTKKSSESLKQKSSEDAKKQAAEIVDNAKKQAQDEFVKASKQVGSMSVDLSKKIVSKILSELFTEQDKTAILSKAVEKIENGGYEKTTN
ncbi:F0F1 ATP synthase subunit B [Candidatus Ruminimicrobiellum ovillum]|uniref:F0F1 ATP synthase subunit B n=1 Tax=Candidatus Ruminimicrobiellum ovillum TaxID=1947927 RepID=UPI0035594C73